MGKLINEKRVDCNDQRSKSSTSSYGKRMRNKIRVSTVPLNDYTTAPSPLFILPPDRIRKTAVLGDAAKMTFVNTDDENGNDRMWVEITKADNGTYEGTLGNHPIQFSPKVLKYGDIVKFSWNNICDILDPNGKSKMHGLDSILVFAQHIEALLKTWALGQPLQPLDKQKCMMIANQVVTLNDLVLEIHDELGLKGGTCVGLNYGKGIEAAIKAAEYLTKVIIDWEKACAPQCENVQEHILLCIPALNALLDTLEPSTKPTAASLLKRLLKDEKVIRPASPEEVKQCNAEMGINPNSVQAQRALALAEQYAVDLNKAMATGSA
jgi:Uncharacterized protein conserved in bacteria (DUF2314)